jgi:HSP20 family molecular chaperone IbpA
MASTDNQPGYNLQSWQPLAQLARIRERVTQLAQRAGWQPAADWFDSGDDLILVLDAPGLDMQQLEIAHDGDLLQITGTREQQNYGERRTGERLLGGFQRSLNIPEEVEPGSAVAQYRAGQLEIRFRKLGRTITVG